MQIDYPKVMGESIEILRQKEKQLQKARLLKRLQLLRLLKSGQVASLQQGSKIVGLSER